ncbi:hypothetical protein Leucomu_05625 [Leucobacter muris]|uniref:Uncharacterized protein n=1 Tax=Leucobacter muris TaxID=1935379 RepID=A0ABX5QEH4_9MICO|nr:hypothetical protein [Leucobacter muris]QAB17467.1 hypothetical protein Leucomu_05625 [Leucobacter muris]
MALVVAALAVGLFANLHRVDHASCLVEDKDRAAVDGGSDMRVYTDCGIFRVKDSLFLMRWDSADVYQGIEVGESYDFETAGWRVPFLSWFPNIVAAEQVTR